MDPNVEFSQIFNFSLNRPRPLGHSTLLWAPGVPQRGPPDGAKFPSPKGSPGSPGYPRGESRAKERTTSASKSRILTLTFTSIFTLRSPGVPWGELGASARFVNFGYLHLTFPRGPKETPGDPREPQGDPREPMGSPELPGHPWPLG